MVCGGLDKRKGFYNEYELRQEEADFADFECRCMRHGCQLRSIRAAPPRSVAEV